MGVLLWVCVTPAAVAERDGARTRLRQALRRFGGLRGVWADRGDAGEACAAWVAAHRKTGAWRLEIVPRLQPQRGFVVRAKRGIVERTRGWFMKHRRLVRGCATKTEHAEAWLDSAMIGIMLRRLA